MMTWLPSDGDARCCKTFDRVGVGEDEGDAGRRGEGEVVRVLTDTDTAIQRA